MPPPGFEPGTCRLGGGRSASALRTPGGLLRSLAATIASAAAPDHSQQGRWDGCKRPSRPTVRLHFCHIEVMLERRYSCEHDAHAEDAATESCRLRRPRAHRAVPQRQIDVATTPLSSPHPQSTWRRTGDATSYDIVDALNALVLANMIGVGSGSCSDRRQPVSAGASERHVWCDTPAGSQAI